MDAMEFTGKIVVDQHGKPCGALVTCEGCLDDLRPDDKIELTIDMARPADWYAEVRTAFGKIELIPIEVR